MLPEHRTKGIAFPHRGAMPCFFVRFISGLHAAGFHHVNENQDKQEPGEAAHAAWPGHALACRAAALHGGLGRGVIVEAPVGNQDLAGTAVVVRPDDTG